MRPKEILVEDQSVSDMQMNHWCKGERLNSGTDQTESIFQMEKFSLQDCLEYDYSQSLILPSLKQAQNPFATR